MEKIILLEEKISKIKNDLSLFTDVHFKEVQDLLNISEEFEKIMVRFMVRLS